MKKILSALVISSFALVGTAQASDWDLYSSGAAANKDRVGIEFFHETDIDAGSAANKDRVGIAFDHESDL